MGSSRETLSSSHRILHVAVHEEGAAICGIQPGMEKQQTHTEVWWGILEGSSLRPVQCIEIKLRMLN
jgi:hypothetical protein